MISRDRIWWRGRMVSATADRKRYMAYARMIRATLPDRVPVWVQAARQANRQWLDARRNLQACE